MKRQRPLKRTPGAQRHNLLSVSFCMCPHSTQYAQPSLSTASPSPPRPSTQCKNILPLPQPPSPPLPASTALDARPILPAAPHIPILYPTERIIRINLPQFNLRQNHPRQPMKHLIHPLTTQSAHLHRNRYLRLTRPPTRLLPPYLPPLRRLRSLQPRPKPPHTPPSKPVAPLTPLTPSTPLAPPTRRAWRHRNRRIQQRLSPSPASQIPFIPHQKSCQPRRRQRPRISQKRRQRCKCRRRRDVVH